MRLIGIDYGSKRVGIALSDEAGKMAFPETVLKNDANFFKNLVALITEKQVAEIVVGYSTDGKGQPNKIHEQVEGLLLDLTLELGLPVHLESERYTTQAALRIQGRNDKTDASAAALILDGYISKLK